MKYLFLVAYLLMITGLYCSQPKKEEYNLLIFGTDTLLLKGHIAVFDVSRTHHTNEGGHIADTDYLHVNTDFAGDQDTLADTLIDDAGSLYKWSRNPIKKYTMNKSQLPTSELPSFHHGAELNNNTAYDKLVKEGVSQRKIQAAQDYVVQMRKEHPSWDQHKIARKVSAKFNLKLQ